MKRECGNGEQEKILETMHGSPRIVRTGQQPGGEPHQ